MTRVAVVGGGQLARMMAPAATAMGVTLRVLVESTEASAALAAHETVVGLPGDADAIRSLLAEPRPDVITWEHEHIPLEVFALAAEMGVAARPGASALLFARDKIAMRERLDSLGLPMPAWRTVETEDEVEAFLAVHGGVGVLKTSMGGYDGKGVRIVRNPAEVDDWLAAAADGGPPLLIEEKVAYDREVAIQVARRPSGEMRAWPLVESIQVDGVCAEVIAPAPELSSALQAEAERIGRLVATELDVTGVLAVEMFDVGGRLLINELAMRPHNSGHWSIEGSVTSQFEQHLRAVLDWPLGDTSTLAPVTVMANVLGGSREDLATAWPGVADPSVKVHLYGKGVRTGRKVGHVTCMGQRVDDVRRRAAEAADWIRDGGAA
ncbi:5-(carboxyamino)imidazole ribonucleotide synthase [Demequina lutea]|uniref:N5-carboxyaminoimidazole ribonucleotide synthase n=1 Tax=Demequina lutea TaxID=431489 RepID=A0A7Y9ZAZ4_9MICO|nr:5-(carboxyamino)imidazole ribonucleotide synthase [Demequina lutea]NYI40780.1 5-(carboxyamino)imidazole ribonucleotide synthase [Demequina lutea]